MSIKKSNSINDLILFVLYGLISREKCTFERLVKECFELFPRVFALKEYPQWPDSRKLDRTLRSLRKKKLVNGDPKTFFILTAQGKKEGREIAKVFRQKKLL